jgi:putative addiction module killer protein
VNINFEILRYQTSDGEQPYTNWIHGLKDRRAANLIHARVDRLESGHVGTVRHIDGKVWEMKIDFGPGYRVYFYREGHRIVILLCGGDKSSQERDIRRAIQYAADYGRRK